MLLLLTLAAAVHAAPIETLFPKAPAAQVEAFRALPSLPGRLAALNFEDGSAALVLGSLNLSPDLIAAVRAAAADPSLMALLEPRLDAARKAAYAEVDRRGSQLAADDDEPAARTAALAALSGFYGRGLQLSSIEFARRRHRMAEFGTAASSRPEFPPAAAEVAAAFTALQKGLEASVVAGRADLRPFAGLDVSTPEGLAVLGTLPRETIEKGDWTALIAARKAVYPQVDQKAAAFATAGVAEDLPVSEALRLFYGRGLQLTNIKLIHRLNPLGATEPTDFAGVADAAASKAAAPAQAPAPGSLTLATPPAPKKPVLPPAPAASSFNQDSPWVMIPLLIVVLAGVVIGYVVMFQSMGEIISLGAQTHTVPWDWDAP